jgi:hypothetical protein
MSYGLAIGLDFSASASDDNSQAPKLKTILTDIAPEIAEKAKDIGPRKALLSISNYRDLDNYYDRGLELFPKIMDRYGHLIRRIVTVSASDDGSSVNAEGVAQEILGSVINDKNVAPGFVLYITSDVYSKLDWQDRDNYHSSVDIAGIKAHKRYSDDSRDCFVVSPIGTQDSWTRKRANLVFERYIKPACEATEYRAKRSDMNVSEQISPEMYKALETSPLVGVYLGATPWNANVMIELGYRMSTKKPIFLLKDATANSDPMPFDIKDISCIDIPGDTDGLSNDDHMAIVRRIQDFIGLRPSAGWTHNYPNAIYDVARGKVKIVEASGGLEELFGERNLVNKDLRDVLSKIFNYMPKLQAEKFRSEQAELIGRIITGDSLGVRATVPIYFNNHKKFNNCAFMPIIDSFQEPQAGVLRLRIVYMEVTGAVKKHQDGYYYCNLVDVQQQRDGLAPSDTVVPLPSSRGS